MKMDFLSKFVPFTSAVLRETTHSQFPFQTNEMHSL